MAGENIIYGIIGIEKKFVTVRSEGEFRGAYLHDYTGGADFFITKGIAEAWVKGICDGSVKWMDKNIKCDFSKLKVISLRLTELNPYDKGTYIEEDYIIAKIWDGEKLTKEEKQQVCDYLFPLAKSATELRAETTTLKDEVALLIETFKHDHVANDGNGYKDHMDKCKKCGLDIRNVIHNKLETKNK